MAAAIPIMRQDPVLDDTASNEMNPGCRTHLSAPFTNWRHNDMGSDGYLSMPRKIDWIVLALVLAGCSTPPSVRTSPETQPAEEATVVAPTFTPGEFLIEADKLDTWNAVGQIAVRTPGVEYEGRAQMLDLYTLRYRGVSFLVQTKSVLLSDTIKRMTTRVTATTLDGKPIDSEPVTDLLTLFLRELPAEIESVRAKQAAEKKVKAKAKSKTKAKKKKKK